MKTYDHAYANPNWYWLTHTQARIKRMQLDTYMPRREGFLATHPGGRPTNVPTRDYITIPLICVSHTSKVTQYHRTPTHWKYPKWKTIWGCCGWMNSLRYCFSTRRINLIQQVFMWYLFGRCLYIEQVYTDWSRKHTAYIDFKMF
jgi:hypothetical protein